MKAPEDKTKEQLIRDLCRLSSRISELERALDKRKHEEELARTEAMYEGLFEFAPDAVIVVGKGGEIVRVNKQAEKLFGYGRDELLNLPHEIFLPSRFKERHKEHRGKYVLEPRVRPMGTELDLYGRRKDGTEFCVDIALGPLKAGDTLFIIAVIRDITDRKRTEAALRRTEALLSEAETLSHSGAWEWNLITNEWTFSEEWQKIHGLRKRTLTPDKVLLMAYHDDRPAVEQAFDDARKGIRPYDIEHRIIRQDTGEVRRVRARGRYIRNALGDVERIYGFTQDITDRKEAEDSLKLIQFSVDRAAVSAFLIGNDARILYVNDQACRALGYTQKELLAMTIPDLDPNVTMSVWNDIWARLKKEGSWRAESLHRRKDGSVVPVEISANYVSFGGREYDWAYSVDIGERKRAENELTRSYNLVMTANESIVKAQTALQKSEERLKRAQEIAHLGSWELDLQSNHLIWSDETYRIFGLQPQEFKATYEAFLEAVHPDDRAAVDDAYTRSLRAGTDFYEIEHRVLRKSNNEVRIIHEKCEHLRDESGRIIRSIGMVHDITDRKRMEDEIRHLAHHDVLTGLPNRRLFRDIAELEVAQARRSRTKLAILFLDLDRFKEINDTLGHHVGDELLKQSARLFRETVRASDTVARIGGDEFNIILADLVQPEGVSEIAQKIIRRFRYPFSISGNELNVTTSIGISVYPDDSTEIATLLRYADIAMYHAKESGRNTFRFYNPAINVRSVERMRLENMLRRSIEMEELVMYYQPQFEIQTMRLVCAEALVRWRHPEQGLLTPDRFLAEAEETGFITEIDEWALKTVCGQVGSWIDSNLFPICVTVNISARRFEKPDLVGRIASVLKETGMDPGCLDLEVTESTAMSDVERTASQLREVRRMGVHVSIDDFGTGYSSLNYLKKLPIERIKIDKSFVQDIAKSADDRAIISAVTSMARKMGIRTVAEGVETPNQLGFLRSAECDEAQGFLFSKPLPAEQFRELLTIR